MLLSRSWFAIERIQQLPTYMCLEQLICPWMSQKHTNKKIQKKTVSKQEPYFSISKQGYQNNPCIWMTFLKNNYFNTIHH